MFSKFVCLFVYLLVCLFFSPRICFLSFIHRIGWSNLWPSSLCCRNIECGIPSIVPDPCSKTRSKQQNVRYRNSIPKYSNLHPISIHHYTMDCWFLSSSRIWVLDGPSVHLITTFSNVHGDGAKLLYISMYNNELGPYNQYCWRNKRGDHNAYRYGDFWRCATNSTKYDWHGDEYSREYMVYLWKISWNFVIYKDFYKSGSKGWSVLVILEEVQANSSKPRNSVKKSFTDNVILTELFVSWASMFWDYLL